MRSSVFVADGESPLVFPYSSMVALPGPYGSDTHWDVAAGRAQLQPGVLMRG